MNVFFFFYFSKLVKFQPEQSILGCRELNVVKMQYQTLFQEEIIKKYCKFSSIYQPSSPNILTRKAETCNKSHSFRVGKSSKQHFKVFL